MEQLLKSIRAIVTDVDGVLTDGSIIFDSNGVETKEFNVKDGLIMKHLHNNGYTTGIITGRKSEVVIRRCEELKFSFHYHGIEDKMKVLEGELSTRNLKWNQVLYIGDDINDLAIIRKCGLGVCPSDAPEYVKSDANYITTVPGGRGVFREVSDMVLKAGGQLTSILNEI